MKARHLCAVLGIAAAVGAIVFMQSLTASADAQAPAVAARLSAPWAAWKLDGVRQRPRRGMTGERPAASRKAPDGEKRLLPRADLRLSCCEMQIDLRPGGRVMQGPPALAVVSAAPKENPYACAPMVEGRWVDDGAEEFEIVCTRGAMMRFARGEVPEPGTTVKFIGEKGAYPFKIVGYLDAVRLPRGWPAVFVNRAGYAAARSEFTGSVLFWRRPVDGDSSVQTPASIAPQFMSDAGRNMDRAKPMLLWAAALTALCLLLNSLFLSIESRRREIALLRTIGMTRAGAVKSVFSESLALTASGFLLGVALALAAVWIYVACDAETFPEGMAVGWKGIVGAALVSPVIALSGTLIALKRALSVKPLEAASSGFARRKTLGMTVAFACGFGAFVAVEVWGTSLTKPFIPSPEWPDAVVSILPAGVSSFDIEKLRKLEGVERIAELQPLQLNILPLQELPGRERTPGAPQGRRQYRNALLLASDWLPDFRFEQGSRGEAQTALESGDNCLITAMMARSHNLSVGDFLELDCTRGHQMKLKIAGVVDLNWHMVTSRGLLRGLNRMPVNTDGPVFVSFDTLAACDPRPQEMVRMTHLWLGFKPEFLSRHGVFPAGRKVESEIVKALGGAYAAGKDGEVKGNAVRLHARDEIADGTLAHGADLVGAMARVPFIFIAVISLGFVAMLVASFDARRREFTVLRSVGATRLQLARVLVSEALSTAVKGIVTGIAGGSLIGWLCTAATRAAMSNWGLPACFSLPAATVAVGALGAVVFALTVSVPVSLYLLRRDRHRRQ